MNKPSNNKQHARVRRIKKASTHKPAPNSSTKPADMNNTGSIRLNRYLAHAGICSRRDADELIEQGLVKVNGSVVNSLGTRIQVSDKVEYKGKTLSPEQKVYMLMNKPKGTVTTMDDPQGRRTVYELIKGKCSERVYPVGRLDRLTTGVLLLTNDGDLAAQLTHPSFEVPKLYRVLTDKPVNQKDMGRLSEGITLEDGPIKADQVNYVEGGSKKEIGIELHSGRNRIVRRMFEHLGYEVLKLDRTYFAGLTKEKLARGRSRFLSAEEVSNLKIQVKQWGKKASQVKTK